VLETLPRHNSDPSPLTRHVTVYAGTIAEDGAEAQAVSALQVFRTTLDGGATALLAGGKIHDRLALTPDGPRLRRRHIKLDTRMLGIGTHLPF
jgi:methanesulfonate monooxygenase small subunit